MPKPGEHKTVQARILQYAQEIGWTYVPRAEAESATRFRCRRRHAGRPRAPGIAVFSAICCTPRSAPSIRNTKKPKAHWSANFSGSMPTSTGNRDFLTYLRNQGKFFSADENRELDLTLIDYGDLARPREQVAQRLRSHRGVLRPQRPITGRARMWFFSSTAFRCWSSSARTPARTRRSRSASIRSAATTPRRRK